MTERPDFSLAALYTALDEQRRARGLSWQQAVHAISVPFVEGRSRPLSASTVTGLRRKALAEGDGVLQMLRWLNRTPESFIVGHQVIGDCTLADAGAAVLRFDTPKLHAALNARRTGLGLTWAEIAREIPGVSATSLMYLSRGGRTGFPYVTRMTGWLGQPIANFTRITRR